MVTTRAFALRDAGECYACQMLFEGGRFRCRPPFLFLHTKRPARFAKSQLSCRSFVQLRQQESNLRWGSQSPLPYRLAMAHHHCFSVPIRSGGPSGHLILKGYYLILAELVTHVKEKPEDSL